MDLTQPGDPPPQPPSWWERHWKWFVPTGCLAILLFAIAFVGGIVFIVFGAMKSSDACQLALARATADERVAAALGSPIEAGYFVSGTINVSGSSGEADMTMPISGPNGKGTIYFAATKSAGEWSFSKLIVELYKTGQRIDLTQEATAPAP